MAQLKLAEQIIAEKEHDLHAVGYRADMIAMEKAALEEELATVKSVQSSQPSQSHDASFSSRVSEEADGFQSTTFSCCLLSCTRFQI